MSKGFKLEVDELYIYINDLTLDLKLGQANWEITRTQKIIIDLKLAINQVTAIEIDHISIIELITLHCQTQEFRSLINLANTIKNLMINTYQNNINNLQIITKKFFPTTNVKEIGAIINLTNIDS